MKSGMGGERLQAKLAGLERDCELIRGFEKGDAVIADGVLHTAQCALHPAA